MPVASETGCAGISCEVGGPRVKRKAWSLQKGLVIFLTDSNISGLYYFSAQECTVQDYGPWKFVNECAAPAI